ncbi:MAG TPA: Xaa-Pro peptidase family protein [Xanthobacteraceae bacterium]|nr:Xaa-Pro peptidase family protein [Xanthobacteraceae bacterium]
MATSAATAGLSVPFDAKRLDTLMDDAGIDVLLVTSKHNVQYLLGGHRAFFFDYMDAFGTSRYLPVLIYAKGQPEKSAYVMHGMEGYQQQVKPLWTPELVRGATSIDAMQKAVAHVKKIGVKARRVGVEMPFLPLDAADALRAGLPESDLVNAVFTLERLRARKSPDELRVLKAASEKVIESMLAVIASHGPGTTKQELADALKREEVNRGLIFEYCLVACGTSHNRAPSSQRWEQGDVLSLDSGGNYQGYIGDLARMAILGEPDAELEDLLNEIEETQRAAMKVIKPGTLGGEIYVAAEDRLKKSKIRDHTDFLAHGMGLVTHEAPRLTSTGPVRYDGYDADKPLEQGMVVSVETTLQHPKRGFIKLEDTVVVTDTGHEVYGEGGRGWNRGGTAVRR